MSLGGLFGGDESPQPQAVPLDPYASEAAQKARQDAIDAALADSNSRGRRSTIAAGDEIAMTGRQDLLKKRSGAASSAMLGG